MSRMILLTNVFPYGNWEPFLETEVQYYAPFEDVQIFSLSVRAEQEKNIRPTDSSNIEVNPVRFKHKLFYLVNVLTVMSQRAYWSEVRRLIADHEFNFKRLARLSVFFSRSHHEYRQIVRLLKEKRYFQNRTGVVIYCYRFSYHPYLASLIARHLPGAKIVSRAHGSDLYEEIAPDGYIPLREFSLKTCRNVFPVSQYGVTYLQKKYPQYQEKVKVSLLGTLDKGQQPVANYSVFRIVTCSSLIPVKRVDLVVDALAKVRIEKPIEWLHFGEGPLSDEIAQDAIAKLSGKVNFRFMGHVSNQDLLKYYRENRIDVFVNVSESEGIPVSIMEALSVGIPVIATNAGGTGEIVNATNGILLENFPDAATIAGKLMHIAQLSGAEANKLRASARQFWEEKFNAQVNYSRFVSTLLDL